MSTHDPDKVWRDECREVREYYAKRRKEHDERREIERQLHEAAQRFEQDWRMADEIERQKARNELVAGCIVAFFACVAIIAIAVIFGGLR
jgi:superfamily II RNA helicase